MVTAGGRHIVGVRTEAEGKCLGVQEKMGGEDERTRGRGMSGRGEEGATGNKEMRKQETRYEYAQSTIHERMRV